MKSFILTIDRATDRQEAIQKEFQRYEVNFDFFYGADWQEFTDKDIVENVDSKYLKKSINWYRPAVHGMLGCWISHRKVWETALLSGEQVIAVFEDDATLTPETKSALFALETCQDKFDIVFIYNGKPKKPLFPTHNIDETFTLNLIRYNSIGAVGYVITRKAMSTLIEQFPKMVIHIDALMHWYWWTGLRTYVLTPQVVFHGDFDQTHHSYSYEPMTDEYLAHLGRKPRNRIESDIRQFFDKLFSKYIPQRIAFRKRMKAEVYSN